MGTECFSSPRQRPNEEEKIEKVIKVIKVYEKVIKVYEKNCADVRVSSFA